MRFESNWRSLFSAAARAACVLCLFFGAAAASPAAQDAQPPVLDRELFFGDPEISGAQLSPDGRYIAFIRPLDGTRNIWVKRTDEPFSAARPITADTKRPIPAYFWTRDSRYILFVQDKGGDENFNVYAVDPGEAPAAGQRVPVSRNLTDITNVRAFIYSVPKTDPDILYIGLNDRDAAWHDVYRLRISTGEKALIRKNTERIAGWTFDLKGKLRLALRVADNGDTEVLRIDEGGMTKVYSCSVFETCSPICYHRDGRRVYMETNKGDAVDLTRLVLLDPESGKEELVESDPRGRVDFGGALFSELTDELVATTYEDERRRIYWKNKAFEADYRRIEKQLPGKDISLGSATADERLWLISAGSDREPGERYLFDRKTRNLNLQYRIFEKLPREHLAPMRAISYKSSDGLVIPAFLTHPKGMPAKDLALMVMPHGGPWARDSWGYDNYAQFLANRGYAVLQPNFRGSTGYGKKFLNAGNLQWGEKMQDDITWGVKHLVSQGIADPKRVGIMGGSYGGYATLAGVAFTPDLYAAAVSIVGPSNLITLLESIPPYWEAARTIFHKRMGNPSTAEGKAQLERQSPLNMADRIRTPLMVVQGANDPRVKKAESDQIVIALRDRGFPVEYLVAPDEGHGFARPVNNMAAIAAMEKFLARHLGGRFQERATPEVAKRLAEITVDPKTVVLARKVDPTSVGVPRPAAGLQPGTSNMQARIEVGGQAIQMSITTTIKEDGGNWVITDMAKTPMGEMRDVTVLDKDSLTAVRRTVRQGLATIEVSFQDSKATGNMSMGGQSRPISAELGGQLFADGAGSHAVMAALPLEMGYTTAFRNFDLQKQKVKMLQLKVVGVEQVTVPAGTFEAFKCEVTSAEGESDKSTVWIAKESRKAVKIIATVPDMGGAVLTSELVP